MDKSQVTFDGPTGWAKGWNSPNSDVSVVKRSQQGGRNVIIWAGIVDQTIIGTLKVKLNNADYCAFIERLSLHSSRPSLLVSK